MKNGRNQSEQADEPLSLRSMRVGDVALVAAFRDADGAARRLAEFGLIRGAMVEMIRAGAPCIVRIGDTRLSVGAPLQNRVLLSPVR